MGLERLQSRWPSSGIGARLAGAALALAVILLPARARAEAGDADLPDLRPPAAIGPLAGRRITRTEVIAPASSWLRPTALRRVVPGDLLTGEAARRALEELGDTGRFAEMRAEALPDGDGAVLRLIVVPRRLVAGVRFAGGDLPEDDVSRAAGIEVNAEITEGVLAEAAARTQELYRQRGFPNAHATIETIATDDDMRLIVVLRVTEGEPRTIRSRLFSVYPAPSPRLAGLIDRYAVGVGDRADDEDLTAADREVEEVLRRAGYHAAAIRHSLTPAIDGAALTVNVQAGPYVRIVFEGNRRFDAPTLIDVLALDEAEDRAAATLAGRIEALYVEHGYYDARVVTGLLGGPKDVENVLVFRIHEATPMRVAEREFPCLSGSRSANDVGLEIDSFLSEALPGTGFVGPVDPGAVDDALGPTGNTGARVPPPDVNPWRTYAPEVYERARRHLQELYRSEGYLSATVGPVVLMRRACRPGHQPGECVPVGERVRPVVRCPAPGELPAEDPAPPPSCTPDPRRGVSCEPNVALHIPIKLGPRAVLWDVSFEGNQILLEKELAEIAELDMGAPVSQVALEEARRRLLDEYAERGFAFATVELKLDLSPDRTRAKARFAVAEREQVRVKDIVVHGARRTSESLILRRVAFSRGDLYRRSAVRATEERLATLSVFASVTVTLEDPEVFAREKVVVITVRERPPQYVDVRPGFSTGDGFRITFEYGHRNIGGEAVKFTLRIQLGLLPTVFILDDEVRRRFEEKLNDLTKRLERRNSISLEFPEVGLGPLFPLALDGIDVRDNTRDFGLTKDAAIITLSYRPTTRFLAQLGGSLERNDATIFEDGTTLDEYIQENQGSAARLRIPEGTTLVVAERTGVTWDRRDDPFNATQGTYVSGSVEHVHAEPIGSGATITSDFMRFNARVGGYLRLSKGGLALALSLRWGQNAQLTDESQTYPDRLFFFGGVDSSRGFAQDSLIPQDIAERIYRDRERNDPTTPALQPDDVVVRGGDVLINPRAELRIPLGGIFQTAVFLDTGNLWLDRREVVPWRLRYASGTGLRANTPVGPLAVDLGVNLDRRDWEDPVAFHFSIGLF